MLVWSKHALERLSERLPGVKPEDFHFRETSSLPDDELMEHCRATSSNPRKIFTKLKSLTRCRKGGFLRRHNGTNTAIALKQLDVGKWLVLTLFPLEITDADDVAADLPQGRRKPLRQDAHDVGLDRGIDCLLPD